MVREWGGGGGRGFISVGVVVINEKSIKVMLNV